ncbi:TRANSCRIPTION INITIATION FACTOR IIB-RELATED [Salix koriyanagi]|uniref:TRANSCRIPTION INITIATION FACTOR IIB-RELATED n=1 Tax=Salix koriyanagi TaxID=2511006 RepID=A0A9Q0VR70_9ROSI|nr:TRANSCRIPTION INITIATION FACTOR IIB-RELATED [Salix koriyanagi]
MARNREVDDYRGYCKDCKANSSIVLDHCTGDTICSDCGLVLESYYIDEVMEWRSFNDDNNDKDPNRVGYNLNPLLSQGNLTTLISNNKGDHAIPKRQTGRIDLRQGSPPRENKLPRTLNEISSAVHGVTKKEINKAVQSIKRHVELEDMGTTNPSELVRRFCSNLGMKNHAVKAVHEAVEKIQDVDVRRNPKSMLAAIIYTITQLSDEKKPLRDISVAADVAEGTIKKSFKDMSPHVSRLVPKWYAREEDIRKICIS